MHLLFDVPLKQLPAYQSINPRPADLDDYWKCDEGAIKILIDM